MVKIKTFSSQLNIFKTMKELDNLDSQVNGFIEREGVKEIISVSDTSTAGKDGETIGIIRVVAYK